MRRLSPVMVGRAIGRPVTPCHQQLVQVRRLLDPSRPGSDRAEAGAAGATDRGWEASAGRCPRSPAGLRRIQCRFPSPCPTLDSEGQRGSIRKVAGPILNREVETGTANGQTVRTGEVVRAAAGCTTPRRCRSLPSIRTRACEAGACSETSPSPPHDAWDLTLPAASRSRPQDRRKAVLTGLTAQVVSELQRLRPVRDRLISASSSHGHDRATVDP